MDGSLDIGIWGIKSSRLIRFDFGIVFLLGVLYDLRKDKVGGKRIFIVVYVRVDKGLFY